ncbi:MAG: phosphoribosylanthranilate isomerase [Chloroflexota bacterium]|nr:phosphoribosylanthranilate isomerase [Chloroflexota bacterium]
MSTPGSVAALYLRGSVVKVCGIREPEHAMAAAEAGADVLGFIFAPARRQVTAEVARACILAARKARPDVLACGVFVNAPVDEIQATIRVAGLDLVQLSGTESPEFAALLPVLATKVFHPLPGLSAREIVSEIGAFQQAEVPPVAFLLDAYSTKGAGGTGEKADWTLASEINASVPAMLAGGLAAENVAEAIAQVRPLGVDVSSGVEIDGNKSIERIQAFVAAARAAYALETATAFR